MTDRRPCDVCPSIPCATGGLCHGSVYWLGRAEKAKPLAEVKDCKHVARCREWYRRSR
jgi:hypothetical protein